MEFPSVHHIPATHFRLTRTRFPSLCVMKQQPSRMLCSTRACVYTVPSLCRSLYWWGETYFLHQLSSRMHRWCISFRQQHLSACSIENAWCWPVFICKCLLINMTVRAKKLMPKTKSPWQNPQKVFSRMHRLDAQMMNFISSPRSVYVLS